VDLANAAGTRVKLLGELVEKTVLKGTDKGVLDAFVYVPRSGRRDGAPVVLIPSQPGPIWYSSRMVKDEYIRTIRGESSRFGASDDALKPPPDGALKVAPKPPLGDGSSSSSSSSIKEKPPKPPPLAVPDWVPVDAWEGYVEMRRLKKKPLTARAQAGIVAELARLRDAGHDPGAVLDQSTVSCWPGVFPLKNAVNAPKDWRQDPNFAGAK
jgi:hypothetical protein